MPILAGSFAHKSEQPLLSQLEFGINQRLTYLGPIEKKKKKNMVKS